MLAASSRPPLAGIVFDLDGTLYDKRALERFMIRRLLRSLRRLDRYTKVRSSLAGIDRGSYSALHEEALRRLAVSTKGRASWRRWIGEVYDPMIREGMIRAVDPYPGVRAMLAELRDAGIRLGLVSDYRGIAQRLSALGIDPAAFDVRLETEELGAMKPAARIVERTLEGMDLPGEAMMMVGDRAFTDLRFAEAAGMEFVGVLPTDPPTAPADRRWRSWPKARAYLLAQALGSSATRGSIAAERSRS